MSVPSDMNILTFTKEQTNFPPSTPFHDSSMSYDVYPIDQTTGLRRECQEEGPVCLGIIDDVYVTVSPRGHYVSLSTGYRKGQIFVWNCETRTGMLISDLKMLEDLPIIDHTVLKTDNDSSDPSMPQLYAPYLWTDRLRNITLATENPLLLSLLADKGLRGIRITRNTINDRDSISSARRLIRRKIQADSNTKGFVILEDPMFELIYSDGTLSEPGPLARPGNNRLPQERLRGVRL